MIPSLVAGIGTPIFFVYNIAITLFAILMCWALFLESVSDRHASHSMIALGCSYLIGQIVICLVVGLSACSLKFGSI